jgi:hypothetical protein
VYPHRVSKLMMTVIKKKTRFWNIYNCSSQKNQIPRPVAILQSRMHQFRGEWRVSKNKIPTQHTWGNILLVTWGAVKVEVTGIKKQNTRPTQGGNTLTVTSGVWRGKWRVLKQSNTRPARREYTNRQWHTYCAANAEVTGIKTIKYPLDMRGQCTTNGKLGCRCGSDGY